MKILIFNWRCWKSPFAGGTGKYLYEISKSLVKKKYKITWFVSSFEGSKERAIGDGSIFGKFGELIRRTNCRFVTIKMRK